MALLDWTTRHTRRTVAKISGISVVAAVVVGGAIIYPGFTTADVSLNDGSVWVTNRSAGLVGHLNDQSKVLDGGFGATATNFDILQNAGNVFVSDAGGSLLSPVDVALMSVASETNLGGGKQAAQGTNLVALTDSGTGKVWALSAAAVPSFSDKTSPTILSGLENPVSVVAPDDTVYTVDAKSGELVTTTVDGTGKVATQDRVKVEALAGQKDIQLTVAGNEPVAFSPTLGKLFLPGNKQIDVPGAAGAILAQPTADGNFVALETTMGLLRQPLDGSAAKTVELGGTGKPIAPVVQGDCIHAAWSGANKYLHSCAGSGDLVDISKATGQSSFVFRKNRDVVVLNDVNGGSVWLVNQNMLLVNNWDDLKTDLKNAENSDKESADPNVVNTLPDRTKPNRPPTAEADSFGVRAGKTTILPVLFNDSDPDGDVLTAEPPAKDPEVGAVQSIYGGTGLQINVAVGATGSSTFNYTANDGRGGTAQGSVAVRVVPASENSAPKPMRQSTMVVESGQSMSQNILSDWIDPDGDDIFLVGAVPGDSTATIKTSPDGELKYTDDGESSGIKTVTVSVSDGQLVTEEQIKVNVKAAGNVPPVANADFFKAVVGQPVVLAPLKNDQDPAGGTLRLASVAKPANATLSAIADNGTLSFTSSVPGPVYMEYQVTNGPMSATGLIRVDVVAQGNAGAPVAVKDVALLPAGGTVLVDVLGNDEDPAGGVLVVQSVTTLAGSPISAAIIDRHIVKLTDERGLNANTSLKYTISNGSATATGEISVIRIPAPEKLLPPRAEADSAIVRAGDIVSIPVLANDVDPNGEVLKNPTVVEAPDPALGQLFTDQNQLRFIAGPTAKTVTGVYKVANSSGQFDSATVTITIVAGDPEHNLPPAPKNLTGRVIAGDQVKIAVPLVGIDPDGDSVELVGLDKAPTLGTAQIANGWIYYTAAGSSSGTDTFTYRVRDRLGAEAVASVNVGIAPPLAVNNPPVTADDFITIRPGRKVAIDVLLNDADPDGGQLAVVKDGFNGPDEMAPAVTATGRVVVTSPKEAGTATMMYTVTDKFGATATGNIRMTVTADAPLRAPIARDDRVTVAQTLGKNTVDVPVLENDEDPDGVTDDLSVKLAPVPGEPAPDATVSAKGVVRVALSPVEQMIPYTVTDVDGLTATAVIWVPGQGKQYPVLAKTDVIKVVAGQSATLNLADYVKVRDGRKPRLTQASKITLLGASADNVIVGDGAGIKYAANLSFFGPGSITFEVTDGAGPDDPDGLKSTLTVMTQVEKAPDAATNTPPTFRGTTVDVPQAETATQNLAPLATDPDPGEQEKLKFAMAGSVPAGFKVSLDGSVLTISQASGTKVGQQATVQVSVTDGKNPAVTADVLLNATSSSKPLPVANDDVVSDAHAGRAEVIKVLANDVNPFPDTPLKVVGTSVETGSTGISVSNNADSVTVNSDENYKGTVVVRYIVEDKTADEARYANGRIRITIKGKPDAPSKPQIVEEKDQSVLLSWTSPADNGSPISKYTVAWAGGSQDCGTNTCTITGLKNALPYKFTVTATNDVGTSAASAASAAATPDRIPDAPNAPVAKFGDKEVALTWNTPVGEFSAVKSYNVQISPAPAGQNGQKTAVVGNSLTWTGLANGTAYQFRVQAVNNAPKPSEWGTYSVAEIPAGIPAAPAAPSVAAAPPSGGNTQVTVSWGEPFINGDAISAYVLEVSGGGQATRTITTSATTQAVSINNSTASYQFRVNAKNKAGTSAYGPLSAPQRAVGKVGMMAAPGLTIQNTSGAGGAVQVTYSPLGENQLDGYAASEVTYCVKLSSQASEQCGVASGATLASPNNVDVYATVRAVGSAAGKQSGGDASPASPTVHPYGVPGQVSVTGSKAAQTVTTLTWTWVKPNSNGDIIRRYEVSLNGGGWIDVGDVYSYSTGASTYNESKTLAVRACNAGGCGVPSPAVTSTAGDPPTPPVTQWSMTNIDNDSCMDPAGGTNWNPPRSCNGNHWLYRGQTMQTRCYINRNGSVPGKWYLQIDGPNAANNGLYARWDAFSDAQRAQPIPPC